MFDDTAIWLANFVTHELPTQGSFCNKKHMDTVILSNSPAEYVTL